MPTGGRCRGLERLDISAGAITNVQLPTDSIRIFFDGLAPTLTHHAAVTMHVNATNRTVVVKLPGRAVTCEPGRSSQAGL